MSVHPKVQLHALKSVWTLKILKSMAELADYGNANDNSNNDHFLSANSNKALSTLQNTRLGSGLVYTQTSKIITQ